MDYCLKVREQGYRVVFTPFAELLHFESLSRKKGVRPGELELFRDLWGDKLANDPYYITDTAPVELGSTPVAGIVENASV